METGAASGDRRTSRYAQMREYLAGPDRYGAVLVLLIASFVLLGVSREGRWLRLVVAPLLIVTLEFILKTSGASRSARKAAWVIDGIVVLVAIVQVVVFGRNSPYATYAGLAAVSLTGMYFMFRRILEHQVISIQTLLAAASVYVLIGLSFAFLLLTVGMIVGPDFLRHAQRQPDDYVYQSFITLTTVGYGDIFPGRDSARVLLVLEALVGQLFLATVIARLVAGFGRQR
jgi:voltage-gated potassium channel Kch